MRVMVTGGRSFSDMTFLFAVLDAISARRTITEIVHGCGEGTDAMADHWANLRGVPTEIFVPDWETYGPIAAEPVRNTEMIATMPDLVVAFPGGRRTGVCRRQAEVAGLKVFVPAYNRPVPTSAESAKAEQKPDPEPEPKPEPVAAPEPVAEPTAESEPDPTSVEEPAADTAPVVDTLAEDPVQPRPNPVVRAAAREREPQPVQMPLPSKRATVDGEFVADSGHLWTRA